MGKRRGPIMAKYRVENADSEDRKIAGFPEMYQFLDNFRDLVRERIKAFERKHGVYYAFDIRLDLLDQYTRSPFSYSLYRAKEPDNTKEYFSFGTSERIILPLPNSHLLLECISCSFFRVSGDASFRTEDLVKLIIYNSLFDALSSFGLEGHRCADVFIRCHCDDFTVESILNEFSKKYGMTYAYILIRRLDSLIEKGVVVVEKGKLHVT